MTDVAPTGGSDDHCPHCGAALIEGTTDLAGTPDHTEDVDLSRAELRPGQMVRSATCPTPGCPGPDQGAQV